MDSHIERRGEEKRGEENTPTPLKGVALARRNAEELLVPFDPETYHDDCRQLARKLCVSPLWPALGKRDTVRVMMRVTDGSRTAAFARTQSTMARDFKLGKELAEKVVVMKVTPEEFAFAVRYHQTVVFGDGRQGYKQWWPNFCLNFEPIMAELRKEDGASRSEMICGAEAERIADARRAREDDFQSAKAKRADPETAKQYADEFRRNASADTTP